MFASGIVWMAHVDRKQEANVVAVCTLGGLLLSNIRCLMTSRRRVLSLSFILITGKLKALFIVNELAILAGVRGS